MSRSPKLHFGNSFILYYIIYNYEHYDYFIVHLITNLIVSSLYYNSSKLLAKLVQKGVTHVSVEKKRSIVNSRYVISIK